MRLCSHLLHEGLKKNDRPGWPAPHRRANQNHRLEALAKHPDQRPEHLRQRLRLLGPRWAHGLSSARRTIRGCIAIWSTGHSSGANHPLATRYATNSLGRHLSRSQQVRRTRRWGSSEFLDVGAALEAQEDRHLEAQTVTTDWFVTFVATPVTAIGHSGQSHVNLVNL